MRILFILMLAGSALVAVACRQSTTVPGSSAGMTEGSTGATQTGNTTQTEEGSSMATENKVTKTDEEWRKTLTDEQYRILRKKGTERAFSGDYWNTKMPGAYVCAGCGQELFSSEHKFDSGTGWPSYYQPAMPDHVTTESDRTFGMKRTEVLCSRCGGHLGHVFPDGPEPTGERYCINSAALRFVEQGKDRGPGTEQ